MHIEKPLKKISLLSEFILEIDIKYFVKWYHHQI